MKVTLSFSLPDDKEEYETTMNAQSYSKVIWELDHTYLRRATRYGEIPPEVLYHLKEEYAGEEDILSSLTTAETRRLICTALRGVRSILSELKNTHNCAD